MCARPSDPDAYDVLSLRKEEDTPAVAEEMVKNAGLEQLSEDDCIHMLEDSLPDAEALARFCEATSFFTLPLSVGLG